MTPEKDRLALLFFEDSDRDIETSALSALSHELRNILAAISVGLQILDISGDINEIEQTKYIMKKQIDQACRLMDDLLDITRNSKNN